MITHISRRCDTQRFSLVWRLLPHFGNTGCRNFYRCGQITLCSFRELLGIKLGEVKYLTAPIMNGVRFNSQHTARNFLTKKRSVHSQWRWLLFRISSWSPLTARVCCPWASGAWPAEPSTHSASKERTRACGRWGQTLQVWQIDIFTWTQACQHESYVTLDIIYF